LAGAISLNIPKAGTVSSMEGEASIHDFRGFQVGSNAAYFSTKKRGAVLSISNQAQWVPRAAAHTWYARSAKSWAVTGTLRLMVDFVVSA
jgi:hypothetical protein